jgi:hypothetical protein
MLAGPEVPPGELPKFRGQFRRKDRSDLLFGRVERRVNARLHFAPC